MAKVTLYELTERYRAVESLLDSEDITQEEAIETLNNIKEEMADKIENLAKLVLTTKGSIETIRNEEKRLYERRQAMVNRMEWVKNYMLSEMLSTNTYKVKRDTVTVSVLDNPPSIEVVELDSIPDEFRRVIPEHWEPDKKAMLEHFKDTGEITSGTDVIVNKKHVSIR